MTAILNSAILELFPAHYSVADQVACFPETRYMGSKYKLLPFIYETLKGIPFDSCLDAFSGSGSVSYLLKAMDKEVASNDHLEFCYRYADALVANSSTLLSQEEVGHLITYNRRAKQFISRTFGGLYFSDDDNRFLDSLIANVAELEGGHKKSLALAAACRACVKRRARGVFTYTGQRYDDGRRDLQLTLKEHFVRAVGKLNHAVFSREKKCVAYCTDVWSVPNNFDLVYIDPPYVSLSSDNDYTRRYHFLEGLVRYWKSIEIQQHTRTKKFRPLHTPFRNRKEVADGFDRLFAHFADSVLVVSYSSTAIPTQDQMVTIMKRFKSKVEVVSRDHSYSFGTYGHKKKNSANRVQEFLFIGT